MNTIDWFILGLVVFATTSLAWWTRRYTKSVADFVAADRCAGRYVLGVSEGIAMIGAISVVLMFEMYYKSGFSAVWWGLMQLPIGIIVAVTGWVIYRYRQTRVLTLAQFLEMRYSRRFRIFAGALGYISGILNYGIFPIVSAKFFVLFLGLPLEFSFLGLTIPCVPAIMAFFLSLSLCYVFVGGQLAVMVTDFYQGVFCNLVFVTMIIWALLNFEWSMITEAMASSESGRALMDPMIGGADDDFGFVFFAIWAVAFFFNNIAWQGRSGFNVAASSPHEAKMAKVLGTWRQLVNVTVMVVLPICVWAVMHHSSTADQAAAIQASVDALPDKTMRQQGMVPVALTHLLPAGLMGLFAAMMFAAMTTTDQPYLHSWGSILVQDVIIPLRGKPLSQRAHLWMLRVSIIFVAVFAFFFGLLFQQTQYIAMYFQITGAIFMGGAGAVIIGGLYTRWGTTEAAWATMIIGSMFALFGVYATNYIDAFPLNGMHMFGLTMLLASTTYIVVSLLTRKQSFNLDKLLLRGRYAENEHGQANVKKNIGWRSLITSEFTRADKLIYIAVITWTLGLFSIFLLGTIAAMFVEISFKMWANFWWIYVIITCIVGLITAIWFGIGGTFEVIGIFRTMASAKRNALDDGYVQSDASESDERLEEIRL
ncbi:Sodium:solute symporter family protein [Poriferisphaera corsica]|uniref:Sodium:solute symporter family protein n=1 Tax=Poriferisphaera corsica TaxID=2528020 RepID=A0A517YSQ4_9BACT|nr:sodium:solute symporter [Poriferisphaera corsica]QDU33267.1 Sodium:solute symporter family protein [Poriferisphaera corsica]